MDIIVIDPGHGGESNAGRSTPHGACIASGVLEKDITLRLAEQVAHHLGDGARLTRNNDVNLSLADRVAVARRAGARAFVSLHVNAAGRGVEAFVHPRANAASRALARTLYQTLSRHGGGLGGVKEAEMAVLSPPHHATMTAACLVELDCLASPDLVRQLGDASELDRIGRVLASAISEHTRSYRGITRRFAAPSSAAATVPATDISGEFLSRANQVRLASAAQINAFFKSDFGAEFIPWFNGTLAGKPPWSMSIGSSAATAANFVRVWDQIPALFGEPTITLTQFLALMSIFINEVGANMLPVSELMHRPEHPGLAYPFDEISKIKASYNTAKGNITAFDLFNDPAFISAHGTKALGSTLRFTSDTRWKGTSYPSGVSTSIDPAVTGFIQEADFCKFRGRGFIQTTGRSNYKRVIEHVQAYTGLHPVIRKRATEWASLAPEAIATMSSNEEWDELFHRTDLEIACASVNLHNMAGGNYLALSESADTLNGTALGSIWRMGLIISGPSSYPTLFKSRVVALTEELFR